MAALNETSLYLLQTLFSLVLMVVLLRFLMHLVRADFYNPITQLVLKITDPMLNPLRRIIPSAFGVDMAALALLIGLQTAALAATLLLMGQAFPHFMRLLAWSAIGVAGLLVSFYFFAVLATIILSWVAPRSNHPAVSLLYQLTWPVMVPFRRLLPSLGGLDLSPILVFITINIVQIFLRHAAIGMGLPPALVAGI